MPSKKALREEIASLHTRLDRQERKLQAQREDWSSECRVHAATMRDRDKYLRQLQDARSAFEDLKRALYPGQYNIFTPGILPSPLLPINPFTITNGK